MTVRARKKLMSVRLNRNGKTLNFSSQASMPLAGYGDVEVFEKDGVIAVSGATSGSYHISGEVGRPRKALSNARLVEYIREKFGCELGGALPVWLGEEENVLFFGGMQPQAGPYVLDEDFMPVEVEYNRRAGDWAYVHDNWIEFTQEIREALPERLSASRCGRVVLLNGDPAGKLALTPRRQSNNLMLVSHALADHLRSLYDGEERGMRLYAALLPNGVALADNQELLESVNLTCPERLVLDESKYCFVTTGAKGTLYLSATAWEQLERAERMDIYDGLGCLALRSARDGMMKVTQSGYAHYIHSKPLCMLLKERWPEAKKLHLLRHGDLWLLWPSTARPAGLPAAAQFQRLDLTDREQKKRTPPQRVAAEERSAYGR